MKAFSVLTMLCAATVVAIGSVAHAQTAREFYVCYIERKDNFFADEIVFAIDPSERAAMVVDEIVVIYNGGVGREAVVSELTDRKIVLNWELPMTNMSGQTTQMRFRAVIQRPSRRLLIGAKPAGYATRFNGRGFCDPVILDFEGL